MVKPKVRFIHSSDWQLGMTRSFLGDEASARFSQARIDAIVRLGELATAHQAQFLVVAGDVFESNQLTQQVLARSLEALATLPVPVFLLPGNHDPLNAASIFNTPQLAAPNGGLRVLRDGTAQPVPGLAGVEVVGAPWFSKHPSGDLCAALLESLPPADDTLRIAVAHGQTDTLAPDLAQPGVIELAAAERAIADGRIHYLALGDRHSLTAVGDSGRVWYSGTPVVTAFDEIAPNQALLVTLDDSSTCDVQPLAVGDWRFDVWQRELTGVDDVLALAAEVQAVPDKARTVLKIGLTGQVGLAQAAQIDELFESSQPAFAALWQRERSSDLAIVPDALDNDSVELNGYAQQTWQALLDESAADPTAQDALRLLYRLSGRGAGR